MPDITLRLHRDMIVMSSSIDAHLEKQGIDIEHDREFISLIEPETVQNAYRLEMVAGAQCLVTNTAGITEARLAHIGMEERALELATASLAIVNSLKPQHVLAEIGSTRLPLDVTSKNSLKQNRDQYARAARAFGVQGFDAYFLNGMVKVEDMHSALMGIRMESDLPIIASLDIDGYLLKEEDSISRIVDGFKLMEEYGAQVVGFASAAPLENLKTLIEACTSNVDAALLVQLVVKAHPDELRKKHQMQATAECPYYCSDTMVDAATTLHSLGVQFLRASGQVSSAYTSALSVASEGLDVVEW